MRSKRLVPLVLLLILAASGFTPRVQAQPSPPACPAAQRLPPADEEEIRRQAAALLATYRAERFAGWDIVAIAGLGDWGIVSIAPRDRQGLPLPGDGDILLAHRAPSTAGLSPAHQSPETGSARSDLGNPNGAPDEWRVLLPDAALFRDWLEEVPVALLVPFPERGQYIVSAVPAAPTTGVYLLPYECGRTALASRAGPDHDNAIDLLIDGVTFGGELIVAAQEGWVFRVVQNHTACCCSPGYSSNSVILQHPNGEYSYYLHLAAGSVTVQVGEYVYQGQPIAREGDVGYTCSSAGGLCHSRFCDVPGDMDYCCEHLHFEVRDNGLWQGERLEPRFADVSGEFVQTGQWYVSGNCGAGTLPPITTHTFAGTPGDGGWYLSPVEIALTAQDPGGCGVHATYYDLDGSGWMTYTAPFVVGGAGEHTLGYYSVDNCGNVETPTLGVSLRLDLADPTNPTAVRPSCTAPNNTWQNTCDDVELFWAGAGDGDSGLRDYPLYWGPLPNGQPFTYTAAAAYDPGAVTEGLPHFLRLATRDLAGRQALTATLFVLRYDATSPTITAFVVAGGVSTTHQVTVRLDLAASDSASGPAEMRFSNNGLHWSPWQPFATQSVWSLPVLDRRTVTVTAQVRDRAGNVATARDAIFLDLTPPPPHATSFRLCASTVDIGGSGTLTSTSFALVAAVGQPWASGGEAGGSAGFRTDAGLLATIIACRPLSWTVTPMTLTQWVVGTGGNGRRSTSFRLGDTTGESAATGVLSSPSFRLASGFWAPLTGTVPPPPTLPTPLPLPPPTPIPTPPPTPRPADFGVAIDGGYTFTNRAEVTLTLQGPGVTHARVNDTPDWAGVLWQPYRPMRSWIITTAAPYLEPRYVYAQFRDAAGTVYGDYVDGIVYDPVPPVGQAHIVAQGAVTVTLWLTAMDDNSGVGWMRLAGSEGDLGSAPWQPFAETAVFTPTAEGVYAQFRDRAENLSTPVRAGRLYRIYLPVVTKHTPTASGPTWVATTCPAG